MEGLKRRFAPSLRVKLALIAFSLLALPWTGIYYVNEMERLLLRGQEQTLLATARAVATALHDRPELLSIAPELDSALRTEAEAELRRLAALQGRTIDPEASPDTEPLLPAVPVVGEAERRQEVTAILRAVQRSSSRIWVINQRYKVLALAGSLRRDAPEESARGHLGRIWAAAAGWLIRRPSEDFVESVPDAANSAEREIAAALQGAPGTRSRQTRDGRAVVVSAAHPIWSGREILGAVVVEETTNPILSLRGAALERLLGLTLAVFAGVGLILIVFATRLSQRIRRLRDEAESAIDASGHIRRLSAGSDSGDEIGDLSRSFSAMLEKLAQHHSYLENLAGRLSHELRTPIAVVRSSLENLKLAPTADEAQRYVARAEEGLTRLNTILQRMSEASRLEQGLASVERERYDLAEVVAGCIEGYRIAYPRCDFRLEIAGAPLPVRGAPDLAAQLLDKLAENAVQFSAAGSAIDVSLRERDGQAELVVANKGPLLPATMQGRLFESMVSVRQQVQTGEGPHLGLGLYVVRLIAEFHAGSVTARNQEGGDGVMFVVRLPLHP